MERAAGEHGSTRTTDYGQRTTRIFSVVVCLLSSGDLVRLKTRLYDVISVDRDQVLFIPLCGRCASAIEALGRPIEAHDVRDVAILT